MEFCFRMSAFQFKQFTIYQDKTAMKVGTDGVLLGAWAAQRIGGSAILDIGTGTGLIALMLAQKFPAAAICAIERNEDAFVQARENIANSKWSNHIQIHHIDLQDFILQSDSKFDVLVCNPPYFIRGWQVEDVARKMARDADHLPHDLLIAACKSLLTAEGHLYIILPVTEAALFIVAAEVSGFYCNRKTNVITREGQAPKRVLMDFSAISESVIEDFIQIADAENNYTDGYKNLTSDYYLNF